MTLLWYIESGFYPFHTKNQLYLKIQAPVFSQREVT